MQPINTQNNDSLIPQRIAVARGRSVSVNERNSVSVPRPRMRAKSIDQMGNVLEYIDKIRTHFERTILKF